MSEQSRLYHLLKRPLVTEKSTAHAALNKYTFEVVRDANKVELKKAFELAFPGRKVQKVHLIKVPGGTKRVGKSTGRVPERLKAIFTITGEPINELFSAV